MCIRDDERPLRIATTTCTATPDNHSNTQVQRSNIPGYRTAILVGLIAAVLFFILYHSQNVLVDIFNPPSEAQQSSISPLLLRYTENIKTLYKNQPEVPGIEVLFYDKFAVKFYPPVFYEIKDLGEDSQTFQPDESKELYFDTFFKFTSLGQRILIQGRPGNGKTTLVNRLTKEWWNKTENSKIAECPLLLRVTLRELRMERPSGENLSLSDILRYSMSGDIKHIDEEIAQYLSEPRNAESLCIIFDGLDEYPPAYNDPGNYIYKIIDRRQLIPATVIVLSRPEAYEAFFETSGASGFKAYELTGFNSKGIEEYVTSNIPDQEYAEEFLNFLKEKPAIFQLCTSPLHLTMFVESAKGESTFPSTLTEAYTRSISKSFRRELRKFWPKACANVRLTDLPSLRLCNSSLADTIVNVSKLAFDSLTAQDLNLTLHGKKLKSGRTQFNTTELHSYLPDGDNFGLLSPHQSVVPDGYGIHEKKFSFPHLVIQEFWAAFHAAINNKVDISDFDTRVILHRHYFYFACGLYSSNIALLSLVFDMLRNFENRAWTGLLNDYTMCGLEAEHKHELLAAAYLHMYGTVLNLDHLMPYSTRHVEVRSLLTILHLNITRIRFTQHSPSMRMYVADITNPFPNLNLVDIHMHMQSIVKTIVKYPVDFTDNLKLLSSNQRILPKLEWFLPLNILIDHEFLLTVLSGTFSIEVGELDMILVGSLVGEVPKDLDIYASCSLQWETLPVVQLTPDMFITFLAKFIDFHRASDISINCVTPVSFLDCQYVQRLFEMLYDSYFYSVVRKFELMDTCTHSYAASQPDSNSVEIILRNNPVSEKQRLLYLTLSSGLVNDTVTVVHNCTDEHLHILF